MCPNGNFNAEVRLRPLRGLRRDSLRLSLRSLSWKADDRLLRLESLPSRSSLAIQVSEGWLLRLDSNPPPAEANGGTGSEMPLCERAPRARLQIFLESNRCFFSRELHRDHKRPRPITHRVTTRAVVVPIETVAEVISDPGVMTRGVGVTSNDVDDAFFKAVHATPLSESQAIAQSEGFADRLQLDVDFAIGKETSNGRNSRREVRLRSLRELRRDSLRVWVTRLPSRSSAQPRRLAPQAGFEPATLRLTAGCSAVELLRNMGARRRAERTSNCSEVSR